MNEVVVATKPDASLDELMLAMDVVDTLRHRELVLERELTAEERDAQLLERLREIYTGQGIVVTDEVLAQGVKALREERFAFPPPEPTFARTLATVYVTRSRWGKWVGGTVTLVAVAALAFQLFVRGPQLREMEEVPAALNGAYQTVVATTSDTAALGTARERLAAGEAAVARSDYDDARAAIAELEILNTRLQQQYELRVVSRPGAESGFWREPEENRRARNYYLVVEAIGADGRALTLPIRNEEDGRTRRVGLWALRVDAATFERAVADKSDDGIIQDAVLGRKSRGELDVEYTVPTTGATLTDW